ncbi:aldehyde dehydrogenase family protein [Mesorhizobium calcicola]|uniref:Aldehyde dehydrogenase family protein n=1 Tax=Mesorhizobium calcicola TaxID=1300310 RepID=A0ABW4WAG2_9HYPH
MMPWFQVSRRLTKAWTVGNPLETSSLVGPLIDKAAFDAMQKALNEATAHGGKVTGGTRVERTAIRMPIMCIRRWSKCRNRFRR